MKRNTLLLVFIIVLTNSLSIFAMEKKDKNADDTSFTVEKILIMKSAKVFVLELCLNTKISTEKDSLTIKQKMKVCLEKINLVTTLEENLLSEIKKLYYQPDQYDQSTNKPNPKDKKIFEKKHKKKLYTQLEFLQLIKKEKSELQTNFLFFAGLEPYNPISFREMINTSPSEQ